MPENLHIAITGDNQGFVNALNQARAGVRATAREVEQSGGSIEQAFNRIKLAAAGAFAGFSAKAFIQQMVQVRGQFQQLEAAFCTLLGSAEQARDMMAQMTDLAARTPFDLQGVADGARQLLAYGVAAKDITDTLTRLGDIAAGLSIPLNDLVYLYGTTITQGRMYTQDLRQFMGRGIPMAEELARQFGVTKDKVGELVTAGKVGAEEVKKAIKSMTDEGSKFGGLMDAQSKTITGQIANIEDSIDMMLNHIGNQSEGIINGALGVVSDLVENYEQVGKALAGLVATYGTYKAAVMTVTAMEALRRTGVAALTVAETAHYGAIVLVEKAQKLLNATMLANPYVLAASALAGLVAVMASAKSQQDLVNEATDEYNSKKDELIKKEQEHMAEIDRLCQVAGDETISTDARKAALVRLEQQYPSIFKKYDTQIEKLAHIRDLNREIAEYEGRRSVTNAGNELAAVDRQIRALERKGARQFSFDAYGNPTTLGRSRMEDAQLTQLKRRRGELERQMSRESSTDYLKDLTGVSNAELRKQIRERSSLLAKMGVEGKKYGKVSMGGAKGVYDKDELQGQLQVLQSELNRRRQIVSDGSKDFTAAARKAYNREKKALDALRSLTDPKKRSKSKATVTVGGKQKKASELTAEEYADAVEAQQKSVDEAAKKLKGLTGRPVSSEASAAGKTLKKVRQDEADAAQRAERMREEGLKWDEQTARQRREALYAQEEARIAAIADGAEREREERKLQHRKDLDQVDQQERDFRKANYAHNKAVYENSAKENEHKYGGTVEGTALTEDQQTTLDAQRRKIEEDWNRYRLEQIRQRAEAERQAMDDYLTKYGTTQEQRYAIAQEYAQKIKEVKEGGGTDEEKRWRVNSLIKERDAATSSANASSLAMGIDWSVAFKGVGNVLSDIAKETLAKVEEYMKTDEFKKLSAENKRSYTDLRQKLQDETGGNSTSAFNFNIWGKVAKDVQAYQDSVKNLKEKTDAHTRAVDELEKAQDNLKKSTDDASKGIAKAAVDAAKQRVASTGADQNKAKEDADKAQENLTESSNKAANGISNFSSYLSEMSNGSLYGFANGISKLVTSLAKGSNGLGKALGEIGSKVGGIIGAILQILDALADDPKGFINSLFKRITDAVEGILSDLPSLVGSIIKDIGNLVMGIIEGVGGIFGAKDGWLNGSNAKEVKKTTEDLASSNKSLTSAIDALKDSIDKSGGVKAVWDYEQAYKYQQAINKHTMDILKAQMGYHDNHHSNEYYWYLDGFEYSAINRALARYSADNPYAPTTRDSVHSLEDIYELTPEQMKAIATNNLELWQKMLDMGKYDKSEYWENYIALAGKLEELTEMINENLTQVSFDSLKEAFVSDIMDMGKTAADFSDDFTEMMAKAWTNAAVNDLMSDDLERFHKEWAGRMKSGTLTHADIEELRRGYEDLAAQAINIRDTMASVTGYTGDTDSQSASANGASSITYEQSNSLIGLVTAGNVIGQNISDNVLVAVTTLSSIGSSVASQNGTLMEIRNLMVFGNSYLEDILKCEKSIYNDFSAKIDQVNRTLKEMK